MASLIKLLPNMGKQKLMNEWMVIADEQVVRIINQTKQDEKPLRLVLTDNQEVLTGITIMQWLALTL